MWGSAFASCIEWLSNSYRPNSQSSLFAVGLVSDAWELDLPGYDPFGPDGANPNLVIRNTNIDPISTSTPYRSGMCRIRKWDSAARLSEA